MTVKSSTGEAIERRSLEIGKWGNLVMAVAGVAAAFLSNSDALLVDGLYSGVNFVSAIVAAQISLVIVKPADRRYPFDHFRGFFTRGAQGADQRCRGENADNRRRRLSPGADHSAQA